MNKEIMPVGTADTLRKLFWMVDELRSIALLREAEYRRNSSKRAGVLLNHVREQEDVFKIITGE